MALRHDNDISSVWKSIMQSHATLGNPLTCTPATDEEISAAEHRMGYPMPLQLRQLYRLTNGMPRLNGCGASFPWDLHLPRVETFKPESYDSMQNFYKEMEMWCLDNYYLYIDASGIIFEWEKVFEIERGDAIIANSLVEYLKRWDDLLMQRVSKVVEAEQNLTSALSDVGLASLPAEISSMITIYALPPQVQIKHRDMRVKSKGYTHESWFVRFDNAHKRIFG